MKSKLFYLIQLCSLRLTLQIYLEKGVHFHYYNFGNIRYSGGNDKGIIINTYLFYGLHYKIQAGLGPLHFQPNKVNTPSW